MTRSARTESLLANLHSELVRYVELQQGLVEALRAYASVEPLMLHIPRDGTLPFQDAVWAFHRHGAGVRFRNQPTGLTVDVHDQLETPLLFDVWRLRSYFGSKGPSGARCVQRPAD